MSNRSGLLSLRLTSVIPILIIGTFWLGVWGWHDRNYNYLDSLYRAVSLFDLGNDLYNQGGNLDWRFAIGRWTGQVAVFAGKPCYRCLVPESPPDAETCSAVGVVGALAGVIGSMMALEAVKVITSAGEPLTGRLLIYDGLAGEARTVRIGADPGCEVCGGT